MQTQEVLTDVIDMSQSARNYALGTVCDAEEHEDAVEAVIEDYIQGAREMYVKLTTFVNVNDAVPANNYQSLQSLQMTHMQLRHLKMTFGQLNTLLHGASCTFKSYNTTKKVRAMLGLFLLCIDWPIEQSM